MDSITPPQSTEFDTDDFEPSGSRFSRFLLIVLVVVGIAFFTVFKVELTPRFGSKTTTNSVVGSEKNSAATLNKASPTVDFSVLESQVLPAGGYELPVDWGDIGFQLTKTGVIDKEKFMALYADRGGLSDADRKLLEDSDNGRLTINQKNAGILLNLFWAFGLGNKNLILEEGPMQDAKYGGAGGFASTGGWTLAEGQPMDHYSKHQFITLTKDQQAIVESVSRNIYRPCCGNSTYFPDCNHGLAMLGLLEMMAAQNISEDDMYLTALKVNSFWFPDTYLTIAQYLQTKGQNFENVAPRILLSADYSSGAGFRKISLQVTPPASKGRGGCGV